MALREQAQPSVGTDEVLIKVAFAGICGSELSGYLGHNALRVPPLVMGHEFAGELVAVGDAAAEQRSLAEGQPVTVNPLIVCGQCRFCRAGRPQLCPRRQLIGAARPGGFAEYVSVPASNVLPLPAGMPLRIGALSEPVAVATHIGALAGDLTGQHVLIIGAGPIGLLALQVLRLQGAAQVFVSDLDAERLAMAESLGATVLNARETDVVRSVREQTNGDGVAISLDAVGMAATRAQAVSATCSGGVLLLSGLHEETSAMPAAEIIRREITVQGSFCYNDDDFTRAIALLADGSIKLDPWIVEEPLGDGGKWFDRLIEAPGNVAKVLLVP
jgi:threonine dehydrogenase-like Zn-dependent dehydrogenase